MSISSYLKPTSIYVEDLGPALWSVRRGEPVDLNKHMYMIHFGNKTSEPITLYTTTTGKWISHDLQYATPFSPAQIGLLRQNSQSPLIKLLLSSKYCHN